jgi:hypothetical protein
MNKKYIIVRGYFSVPEDLSHDDFIKELYALLEQKGWFFGGVTKEVNEEELMNGRKGFY